MPLDCEWSKFYIHFFTEMIVYLPELQQLLTFLYDALFFTEKTGVGGRVWGVGVKRNSSRK